MCTVDLSIRMYGMSTPTCHMLSACDELLYDLLNYVAPVYEYVRTYSDYSISAKNDCACSTLDCACERNAMSSARIGCV